MWAAALGERNAVSLQPTSAMPTTLSRYRICFNPEIRNKIEMTEFIEKAKEWIGIVCVARQGE